MIQLHVDVAIDPAKEQQMLEYFRNEFRPAARKFEGFIDVQMLKLRSVLMGEAPAGINYRFVITYQSEELRQIWLKADIHQTVWGAMEKMMTSTNYSVLLFDVPTA